MEVSRGGIHVKGGLGRKGRENLRDALLMNACRQVHR